MFYVCMDAKPTEYAARKADTAPPWMAGPADVNSGEPFASPNSR